MFTDIVGYTALMGEDEEKAFELLKKNRRIQRPIIEKYNGRWLKEIGDGVLASFSTVSDAVYCAGSIQKACENESDLKLRIGIHQGEVVFEGEDVFGDGVNIASRLEPLAPIGGILVSESVNRNLGNKKGIDTTFIREEALKNVKDPVRIFEVKVTSPPDSAAVIPSHPAVQHQWYQRRSTWMVAGFLLLFFIIYLFTQPTPENTSEKPPTVNVVKSIAVLPFVNMSNDPEQEYFSDGMMEEILNHLYKIEGLRVTSRTSAMQYKGVNKSIREIGNELGVAHLLEGSVRKSGDRVRITVQLIDVVNDQHLWSDSYDRQISDIFEVQSEIAERVTSALKTELTQQERKSFQTQPTKSQEAYNLYLKAVHVGSQGIQNAEKATELLERALEIDPEFALAW